MPRLEKEEKFFWEDEQKKKLKDKIPHTLLRYAGKVDDDANQIKLDFLQNIEIICQLER